LESDCINRWKDIEKRQEESKEVIHGLSDNLKKLSEAMRIYLKIEWNNAKNRDKDC
jgi:hypothetical protein